MIERMLDETDTAELRALQARAYGRDGELSLEEGARLHELERLRRGVPDPSTGSGSGPKESVAESKESVAESKESVAEPVEVSDVVGRSAESVAERVEVSDGSTRHPHRRWLTAAALLVGLGAGWMIWGWDSAESALAIEHSEQRAELESSGDFDQETVTAISERHGVVVWTAQRSEGQEDCVILTTSKETQSGCGTLDEKNLNSASAQITVPEGDALGGQTLSTFLLQSTAGEVVPAVQIWDSFGGDWEAQYTEDELETIRRIEAAEGIEGRTLGILGYDGDTAVWRTWGPEGQCMIAEADAGFVLGCMDEASPGSELVLNADVQGVPTRYIMRNSESRGEQLTVVKLPALGVQGPSEDGAGAEIDDKTGEIGE